MSDRERRGFVLSALGLEMEVPPGWEARIRMTSPQKEGETNKPVLHAATVPLDGDRADWGGGVVERLSPDDVFVALVEFGPEAVGTELFPEVRSLPSLAPNMFHPNQLQRLIKGQAGTQVFFTFRNRAFCLYVVLGANSRRVQLAGRAQSIVRRLMIRSKE